MTPTDLLRHLAELGLNVQARGDRLHVDAPRGILTDDLRAELTRAKPALLVALAHGTAPPCLHCDGRLSLVDAKTRMWICKGCRGLYLGDPTWGE